MEKKERNRPRLSPMPMMPETAVRARLSRWNFEFVKDVSF